MKETSDTHRNQLEQFLSDWQGKPATILEMNSPKNNGFSAITYLLHVSVGGVLRHWVVQVAPQQGTGLFDSYDMQRSFRLQADLKPTGVPVAPMLTYCDDLHWLGQPFYVMEYVAGNVPPDRPAYHVAGWFKDIADDKKQAIWRNGLAAMAQLHLVSPVDFGYLQRETNLQRKTDLQKKTGGFDLKSGRGDVAAAELADWRSFCSGLTDFGDGALTQFSDALDQLEKTAPGQQVLCIGWGDAKLGNMIFADESAAAILDWELCCIGTPEQDLAHWLAVDWFLSSGIGKPRLAALPSLAESVAAYQSVNDTPLPTLDWWFAFALVRMGLIFHRGNQRAFTAGSGKVPGNPIGKFLPQIVGGDIWRDLSAQ